MIDRTSDPAAGVVELVRRPLRPRQRRAVPASGLGRSPPDDDAPRRTRLDVAIGPHRRYAWVEADLARFRKIKTALGGTVNDVVLAAVAGALGRYLRALGHETDGLHLRALLPGRTPSAAQPARRRVEMISCSLPVGIVDPRDRFALVSQSLEGLKENGRAVEAGIADRAGRLRPVDHHQPGGAPPGALG